MKKSNVILSITSLALVAASAQAATNTATTTTAPAAGQSATTVKTAAPSLANQLAVTYANYFYGPSITKPTSSGRPDASEGLESSHAPLLMKNYLSAEYKISDSLKVGPIAYWKLNPVRGGKFVIGDPYVKGTASKAFSRGSFNVAADLRLIAPVSDESRAAQKRAGIASKQITSYGVPNSRLTLGVISYLGYNAYGPAAPKQDDLEAYVLPNVAYQMLPNLAAEVGYELDGARTRNGDFKSLGTELDIGASWDITSNINLAPYVALFPTSGNFGAKTSSINANLTWKLL
jgi:hypothetical protein